MISNVVHYNFDSQKINDLDIILIGDLHNISGKAKDQIIRTINDLEADVLLIAGDITNTGHSWNHPNQFLKIKNTIQQFAENQKVVIVLGNHDLFKLNEDGMYHYRTLEEIEGVYPLFNSSIDLNIQSNHIHIDGYVPSTQAYITTFNHIKCKLLNHTNEIIHHELNTLHSFHSYIENQFCILLNHDPQLLRNHDIKSAINHYDLITGAHTHNGYIPMSYSTNHSDLYDCDLSYFLFKNKTNKRGYNRGVIYGDENEFLLIDQSGSYFYKHEDTYYPLTGEQANYFIQHTHHAPIVITSGVHKYAGCPIYSPEITKIHIKSQLKKRIS